ncbi:5-AMP-activated protein kinase, regulatory beta subunit [Trypanosoma rangeli]|uniref:5-AMP-activated protein kinase, regulatory beta subunit n=1 Tax=Trypanosoma rangeli TaxID=5698 RepID=A0A3R7K3F4_TRYRA|nr:5-AMP-activated protein kinase, regulatory beta subunit [Trypanosoma rangeli]RNF01023.1 5-AMP-activated protein kinase, regulatory beta subunit [Trypanosoma rangeli]|eukprot:RNF01023.1 5-AMP-activated protein kinase, regulatory beta subunit [Trypanosoma rangeli]
MGQPNGKDSKMGRRGSRSDDAPVVGYVHRGSSAVNQPVRLRTGTMRENILQQPAQHRDPMMEVTLSASGGTGVKRNGAIHTGDPFVKTKKYPIVLRYADKDAKKLLSNKRRIYVAVESLEWRPVQMAPSEDSFYAIVELTPGSHRYRFLVDDEQVVDSTQPLADMPQDGSKDAPANLLQLNEVLLTTKEDEEIMDDGDGWGQNHEIFEETRKYPPIVPVHLRYTPLNTPPTAVRCTRDGVMSAGEVMPPEHLPLPLNVTINHVYFQRREDHSVMGLTTRYCNKYTTVVYYSKMGAPSG